MHVPTRYPFTCAASTRARCLTVYCAGWSAIAYVSVESRSSGNLYTRSCKRTSVSYYQFSEGLNGVSVVARWQGWVCVCHARDATGDYVMEFGKQTNAQGTQSSRD